MKQFYTKIFWVVFLFGILFLAAPERLKAQQLSDDQVSTYVNTANGPQQVKVKIFGGSTACANGILALTLPTGYTYSPNSAVVTPYNAADVAGTPVNITTESIAGAVTNLTIPSIPTGNYVMVTYSVTVACGAETGNISYTLNACGVPASTEVGPINIQKAKLNITINPETYVAPSTGTTYTRNILIKNDGIGKVDTVYLDRTVAAGFTYGAYTITPSVGVTIVNQTLTGNRYRIITSGLSLGQSLTVAETVTINSASNISASYDAWYGPNAVKCNDQNGTGIGSAIITATPPNPAAPGLVLAVTSWPNLKCPGTDYVTVRLTNTNITEAATVTSMIGYLNGLTYNVANVGQRSFFLENDAEISTSSATGPWLPLNASTRAGNYAYNAGHNVGEAIQSAITGTTGDIIIPPSAVYYVRYKVSYNPIAETCPSNNATYWYFPRLQAAYTIAGASRTIDSDNAANNYWQIASPFDSSAPDAVGGTPYVINMNFNVRLLSQAQFNDNTGTIKLVFNLPSALTPSLAPADNTITDGTNVLTPISVTFVGGKLTLVFDNPLAATRFGSNVNKRWTTNIVTQFACNGTNISYSYSMDAYVQMASCGPDLKLLCGATGDFEAHSCNPCATDAATTNGASLTRTTIGTIINPANPISSSHFVTGDRASFMVSGSVNTVTPGKEFEYLFVNMNPLGLTYGTQYEFEAGTTATAIITRAGVDYTITNIPLVGATPLAGETHTIRLHAGTLPAALGGKFLDNDLVKVIVPLRFLVNADQYLNIKGTLYAADVAEPTVAQRLYCDHGFTARGRAVLVSQSIANGVNVSFGSCAQITSGLEGRTDINYMLNGSNSLKIFNNEIREFFTIPNTFTIKTRDFEQITQLRVVVNYQQSGAAPNVIFTPIGAPVPDGTGYHTFTFNLSSLVSNLADARINQSALLQIFPKYKISCASSNFSGPSNYATTYYPFSGTLSHLNQPATGVSQAVDATNGIFIPVSMTTGAAIKTIAGNTATWDVHIANPYNVAKSNVWLAPNETTGFSSIKVFEITTIGAATTGIEVLPNAAGLYELGAISAYGNKFYRIEGVLANCNSVQKLAIVYDFDCEGYPATLQAGKNGCRANILSLEAHPTPASLQVSIEEQPVDPHVICDNLNYTFRINNSSLAILKDLGLNLTLSGVNYVPNSLQVAIVNGLATPAPGDYAAPATGAVTSLAADNYDVSILGSQITAGEFIWIKVSFKPDGCNFISGQRLEVSAHGKDVCGNVNLGDNQVFSNRINIEGIPTLLPTVEITSTATPITVNADGSFNVSAYTLKIKNNGSVAIDPGSGYGFSFKLPTNWTFIPSSIVYNVGTATYGGANPATGAHQFSFSGGLLPGQSIELAVPIVLAKEFTNSLVCGASLPIQETVFAKFTPTGTCAITCEINHVIGDNSSLSLVVPTPVVPTGSANQEFCDNLVVANKPTLANVVLTGGSFVRWYDSATKVYADSIPSTTLLVNGATYYVRNALVNNGNCQSAPFAVTVTVKANSTITLTSGNNQTPCVGAAITPIVFNLTNATGASITSGTLPTGLTGTFNLAAQTYTISGIPTAVAVLATYTVTATGECGSVAADFTLTVNSSSTLVLSSGNNQTPCVGSAITPIVFNLTNATGASITTGTLPAGLTGTFDLAAQTYTISGTPTTAAALATYTVTATGGCASVTANFTLTVRPNSAITLTSGNNQTPCIGSAITNIVFNLTNATGASITTGTLPAGLTGTFNLAAQTYTISGTPTAALALTTYTVTATGECAPATANFNLAVKDLLSLVSVVETCAPNGLTYKLTITLNGSAPFTATGTGASGTWVGSVWTSADIAAGTAYNINFTDINSCNTLNVKDDAPACCVFTVSCPTLAPTTVACYAAIPNKTNYTVAEFTALGGAISAYNCNGVIVITATNSTDPGCGGVVTRTYSITLYKDDNSNGIKDANEHTVLFTQDCIQSITVKDEIAPVFTGTLPNNITVSCDQIPTAVLLTATDNCGTPVVTFNETKTAGNCANEYILTRTWTAKDICGNTVTHTQIIRVEDKTPPVFVGALPSDIKVSCNAIPIAPVLTATDACGAATVSYVEVKTVGTCEEGGFVITRTWTATDACGNTTIHKQVITVENTTPAITVEKVADVQIVREAGDVIKYTIVVTNSGNLTLRNIKVIDPLTGMSEIIAVLAPGEKKTFTTSYIVKIADFNSPKVINIVTATGTDPKGNPVTDEDKEEVAIEPLKLNIPNVITPNGDGKNDTFFVDGLEGYQENNLIIFNRWNNEVYNSHGYYKNNWSGQGLNDGTYYYLLKVKNKSGVWQHLTGHITLLKRN